MTPIRSTRDTLLGTAGVTLASSAVLYAIGSLLVLVDSAEWFKSAKCGSTIDPSSPSRSSRYIEPTVS